MAYTIDQLKQVIYLRIIDNVSEQITPEQMRQVLNAIADAVFEQGGAVASSFYFGPWIARPYTAGSVVVSTDGTKLWRVLEDFNSAIEPNANNRYWKLVAEFVTPLRVNQLQLDLTALQQALAAIQTSYVRFEAGKLYDPSGAVVQVGSDFYFGPWKAQTFKKGWIAIATDKKKQWQAQGEFSSLAEPVAAGDDWKLLFEDTNSNPLTALLANYLKVAGNVANGDTVLQALGKLDKKADDIAAASMETSYAFTGGLEASDRYSDAVEFMSIAPGNRLTDVQISASGSIYTPLVIGYKLAANQSFKIKITYAEASTEGVLLTRVKKV